MIISIWVQPFFLSVNYKENCVIGQTGRFDNEKRFRRALNETTDARKREKVGELDFSYFKPRSR
jgi:hypothetical protein